MADGERPRVAPIGSADRARGGRRSAAFVVAGVACVVAVVAAVMVARWPGEEDVAGEPETPEREPDPAAGEAPTPPGETPDPPAKQEPSPDAAEPAPDVVTEDHDGATLAMNPGDETGLRLSSDWLWEEPEVSGSAVTLATVDHFAHPGYAEWQVEAVAAGTSEVTAVGSPNCGDEAACPPRTVTIRFAVGE